MNPRNFFYDVRFGGGIGAECGNRHFERVIPRYAELETGKNLFHTRCWHVYPHDRHTALRSDSYLLRLDLFWIAVYNTREHFAAT